jgi:hypothetical protein
LTSRFAGSHIDEFSSVASTTVMSLSLCHNTIIPIIGNLDPEWYGGLLFSDFGRQRMWIHCLNPSISSPMVLVGNYMVILVVFTTRHVCVFVVF